MKWMSLHKSELLFNNVLDFCIFMRYNTTIIKNKLNRTLILMEGHYYEKFV